MRVEMGVVFRWRLHRGRTGCGQGVPGGEEGGARRGFARLRLCHELRLLQVAAGRGVDAHSAIRLRFARGAALGVSLDAQVSNGRRILEVCVGELGAAGA